MRATSPGSPARQLQCALDSEPSLRCVPIANASMACGDTVRHLPKRTPPHPPPDVKMRLEQIDGTPQERMRLHFCAHKRRGGERWMEDGQMLKELGVTAGSTILVDRLCDDQWRAKAEVQAKEAESYLQLPDRDEQREQREQQRQQAPKGEQA